MAKRQRPPRRSATTTWYERRLREVARVIDALAKKHKNETDPQKAAALIQRSLFSYAGEVENWAIGVSEVMLRRAASDDFKEWRKLSVEIGKGLKKEIQSAEVGGAFKELQKQQVKLIKSLPEEAAQKVHDWAKDAVVNGARPQQVIEHIVNDLGDVTESRAVLIARTETARAQANFQQARAKSIGSTHYIWHTAGDASVRDRHAALDGTVQSWDKPPVCDVSKDKPIRAHPGCIWNCFPADTLVYVPSDLIGAIRAPFDGRVVDIVTPLTGVTATPNHPMLTQRGWVAAGEVREGDYLLQPLGNAVEMVEPDEDNGIARIGELFDALEVEVVRPAGVHFDFYGDLPDSQVDTTVRKGSLRTDFKAEARQALLDFKLSRSSGVMVGVGHEVPHVGFSSQGGEPTPFLKGGSSHALEHRLRGIAERHSRFGETVADCPPVHSKTLGQGQFAFPGNVTADDIANVKFELVMSDQTSAIFVARRVDPEGSEFSRKNVCGAPNLGGRVGDGRALLYKGFRVKDVAFRNFSGHVYTLITKKGWYGVTHLNLTAKNCRCWAEPIFEKEEFEED